MLKMYEVKFFLQFPFGYFKKHKKTLDPGSLNIMTADPR